jgi:integrase
MAKLTLSPASELTPAARAAAIADLDARIAELTAQRSVLKVQARGATQPRHRQRDKLTDRKIRELKRPGFLSDGGNLYLDAWGLPNKNWVLRYARHGKTHDHGLGSYPQTSLAEARERRDEALRKLRNGTDPIEERRAERLAPKLQRARSMTFRQCADFYIAAHEQSWKNDRHRTQWQQTLESYCYPTLGDLPIQQIDTGLVMRIVQPLWHSKTETSARIRGRVEAILDWAVSAGYRPEGANPARWKGHLQNLLPAKAKIAPTRHHKALHYAELPQFMAELAVQTSIAALALRFTILTACRTGEALGARWDEIDPGNRLWVVPGSRMKGGREHRVPLSEPVLQILETLKKLPASPLLFPGDVPTRAVGKNIMAQMLRRAGRNETVHGFRSSFSDWCTERTHFPVEAREMALAHRVGDAVQEAYRRTDLLNRRRALMDAWAKFCCTPPAEGQLISLIASDRSTA